MSPGRGAASTACSARSSGWPGTSRSRRSPRRPAMPRPSAFTAAFRTAFGTTPARYFQNRQAAARLDRSPAMLLRAKVAKRKKSPRRQVPLDRLLADHRLHRRRARLSDLREAADALGAGAERRIPRRADAGGRRLPPGRAVDRAARHREAIPALWTPPGFQRDARRRAPRSSSSIRPASSNRAAWNAPLDDRESQDRAALFVRSQASAFNSVGADLGAPIPAGDVRRLPDQRRQCDARARFRLSRRARRL